jgi:hypothetical protein
MEFAAGFADMLVVPIRDICPIGPLHAPTLPFHHAPLSFWSRDQMTPERGGVIITFKRKNANLN